MIERLRKERDAAVRKRANTVAHCRRLRQRLDARYVELECVRDERDELVVENIALMLERDRLRKDLASLERGAGAVCKTNNTKLDVIERLRGEVADLKVERDELRDGRDEWYRIADSRLRQNDGLIIQRNEATAELNEAQALLEWRYVKITELRALLDSANDERNELRDKLTVVYELFCPDDGPDENSIPLYKCNADDSRPVFCAVSDCRLRTPHSALEHPGCRGGLWWCPMFEDTVECEVVE